jgi:hypothetical protein
LFIRLSIHGVGASGHGLGGWGTTIGAVVVRG